MGHKLRTEDPTPKWVALDPTPKWVAPDFTEAKHSKEGKKELQSHHGHQSLVFSLLMLTVWLCSTDTCGDSGSSSSPGNHTGFFHTSTSPASHWESSPSNPVCKFTYILC